MEDGNPFLLTILILVLILLEAIVTNSETSLELLNESAIRKKAEKKDKEACLLLRLMEMPTHYFTLVEAILTATNFMLGVIYASSIFLHAKKYLGQMNFPLNAVFLRGLLLVIFTFVLFYFAVFFGRILPKKLARRNPEKAMNQSVRIILFLIAVFKPIIWLFEISTNLIVRIAGINPKELEEKVTEEEIISLVNEGHEKGIFESNEAEMISNIIEFDEKEVKDIMTRKKHMVALNAEMTIEEAIHFMLNESYSRFPLYEENHDNIIGILHLKDIMKYYVGNQNNKVSLKSIAREPYFVPDTQSISVLFHDMQHKKIHMAIAIDEYGQTAGLIAMEDILEEIVGNILDEYDVDEALIVDQGNGQYLMKGLANLEDIEELLEIEIEQEDYDTLNGFLISNLGRIPSEEEKPSVEYKGYQFQIIDVTNKMIQNVHVTRLQ